MSTMMRYDRASLLERLTSNTLFTVLLGIAATVLVPVILYSFTQFTQCVLLGIMLIGAVPWEILGMLLLPIGGMVGYVGLFQARRPATSSADYWATLTCLGVGIAAAGTVIGELLTIDIDYRVVAGFIVVLSLLIVAALGRIVRLRRQRAAAQAI
jgi:hypothetical protein